MKNIRSLVRLIYTRPELSNRAIAEHVHCHRQTVSRYRKLLLNEGRDRWHWAKLAPLSEKALDRELNRRKEQGAHLQRCAPVCWLPGTKGSLRHGWEAYRRTVPNPCSYQHYVREVRAQQLTELAVVPVPAVADANAGEIP